MVDGGAQCVYVVDSAGALVLGDAQARVAALVDEIGHEAQVGFHGHQNLSLGIANSVLAAQNGALQIDGALCALGAGAGNSPTEVLVATFDRLGIPTGVDVQGALAAAEDVVRPFLPRLPFADRGAITQGYAGVYSSFLLHAERAAERYQRPGARDPAASRRGRLRRRPGRHDHRRRAPARRRARPRSRLAPAALEALKKAARSGGNVFAVLMDAARVCSLQQITEAFFEVGGQYRRKV